MRLFECDKCQGKLELAPNDPTQPILCKCGGNYQEKAPNGELVIRIKLEEYMKKDMVSLEQQNLDLMNKFMGQAAQYFGLHKGIQELLEKHNNLNIRHQNTLELFKKKLRLHKQKDTRWGYDPYRKEFVGFKKPEVGTPVYKEESNAKS